ncbi:class A beta-lactamase-related serine hydrolase [Corallococcus praedator]|uniref:Class A beta-lactamase-related serine hydrolase n=1 Tax=Corallococcus praedator TaxID=2316724 RepID=A0ABX9QLQ1_9BACT|nr:MULTISPECIES: serine hydrolase domain-containing protein [Corallococcus]RKH18269.1 class A beta-lactamase-related serine hydrolase [Corallococcus sp. CA047B]RKH32854.1 class A beta-lactamase-related serine hydrolase [Corallococcus sp. CA031C]RKI11926.1 class A beta-lactamase-related serine hydrolase [Corallococcus praedator]
MAVLHRGLRLGMTLLASVMAPACGPEFPPGSVPEVGELESTGVGLEEGARLPPLNREALRQAISGLPDGEVTGALVRVDGAEGRWIGASGVADVRTGAPVRADARFRIGSMTKTFTATVVLQLAAERRLDLDRPVQEYLPRLLPANVYAPITVRQLLNHTHGLPGVPVPQKDPEWFFVNRFRRYSPRELVSLALPEGPRFAPGTQQQYGNIGYIVAGLLIEQVTGRPYGDAVRDRILRPLGLRDTFVPGNLVTIPGPHAHGYEVVAAQGEGCPTGAIAYQGRCLVDVTEASQSVPWAAGEMISSTADLDRFLVALFQGRLLPRAQMEALFTVPDVPAVGGGRATYSAGLSRMDVNGLTLWGKSGDRHGYNNGMGATRDLRRRLIYSVNTLRMGQDRPDIAARIVAAAMAGLQANP